SPLSERAARSAQGSPNHRVPRYAPPVGTGKDPAKGGGVVVRHLTPVVIAASILIPGCRSPLPEHPWTDRKTALRLMSERDMRIRTVESGVRLILTAKDGGSVTLDGAI